MTTKIRPRKQVVSPPIHDHAAVSAFEQGVVAGQNPARQTSPLVEPANPHEPPSDTAVFVDEFRIGVETAYDEGSSS